MSSRIWTRRMVVHFAIPFGIGSTLVLMYFSGNDVLQGIVCPRRVGNLHPNSFREFGLLENLQNLLLLAMIAVCLAAVLRKRLILEKLGFGLLAFFTLFVFLEEIDYGLHFYEYLKGVNWQEQREVRNWHNQGERTDVMKQLVDAGMIALFLVAPLALSGSRNALIRHLTPDRIYILTLLAAFLVRTLAHTLNNLEVGKAGFMHQNLSEFRELVTYYTCLLYLGEITFRRSWRGDGDEGTGAQTSAEPIAA